MVGIVCSDKRGIDVVIVADVCLSYSEGVRVTHLECAGVESHVVAFFVALGCEEGSQEFGIQYVSTLILEDLIDGIRDFVIPEEIILDIVGLVSIVLCEVGQLLHQQVLLVLSHTVDLLLLAHQELTIFLNSLLLCNWIQAIIFSREVYPPRIVGHLAIRILFVVNYRFVRKDEDDQPYSC